MRQSFIPLLALIPIAAVLILSGCVSQSGGSQQIKAVATILPLEEFVKQVGGDRVSVVSLVPPGGDPHTFEPSPSQMRDIADADIYIENGAGLEMWMDKIVQVNERMLIVDTSKGIDIIEGTEEGVRGADPHFWASPRSAEIQVKNICDGLIKVDPAGRDYYIKNRDEFIGRLKELDAQLSRTFADHRTRKFIVLHPSWTYIARDYGLDQIVIEVEEKEPGPKYLMEIVDTAKANSITTIFTEPEFNPRMAEVIAKEIGGKVVALDPFAPNYLENTKYMCEKIAESLGQ